MRNSKYVKYGLVSSGVLAALLFSTAINDTEEAYAKYRGTQPPASSQHFDPSITNQLSFDGSLSVVHQSDYLKNSKRSMYPKDGKSYWGGGVPYVAVNDAGEQIPAFCLQSMAGAPSSLQVQGMLTDSRLLGFISDVTGGSTDVTSAAGKQTMAALQYVLWPALNGNLDPNIFDTGVMSYDPSDYDSPEMFAKIQEVQAKYREHLSKPKKDISPIVPAGTTAVAAACSKPEKTESEQPKEDEDIVEGNKDATGEEGNEEQEAPKEEEKKSKDAYIKVPFKQANGQPIENLSEIADVTIPGFETATMNTSDPAVQAELAAAGVTPDGNSIIIKVENAGDNPGEFWADPVITYKGEYAHMNNFNAVTYSGGGGNQPFLALNPEKPSTTGVTVNWGCEPDPPVLEVESESEDIIVRWYNIPSAFGEIKDGVGYNRTGVTTGGGFAGSRAGEEFEAMLGVPTTERFYINLGGTEGVLDVEYKIAKRKREFALGWSVTAQWTYSCGSAEYPSTCTATQEVFRDKYITWEMDSMTVKSATFRSFADGTVVQAELGIQSTIKNSEADPGSYTLQPVAEGLKPGPGVGEDAYGIGATNAFQQIHEVGNQGIFNGRPENVPKDYKYDSAKNIANGVIGDLFVQNDDLTINLHGKEYKFSVHGINKKKEKAFQAFSLNHKILSATNEEYEQAFKPLKEKWDVWGKVGVKGYTGNATDDAARNNGTPLIAENLAINYTLANGIYHFQDTETTNVLDYDSLMTAVKGDTKPLNSDVSGLLPAGGYKNEVNPTDPGSHLVGNTAVIQYTNWQVPVSSTDTFKANHSGKKPDGNRNSSLGDNPTYRSLNPILLHNPTTVMYSWIQDVNEAALQDQRIEGSNNYIKDHPSTVQGVARQYVDYDFTLYIPNDAAFRTYWGQTSSPSEAAGIVDADHTAPGTIGKSYEGTAQAQVKERNPSNPYGSAWDVSKWTNAKYVKFPYKVCDLDENKVCKNYYAADTWITLYDDGKAVQGGDPTSFNFHVTSDQKDIKNGVIYILSEAINSPPSIAGNPDALYADAEQYVNGTRQTRTKDGEARHSTANQINVDLIGRIGNVAVSDTSDPSWTSVFWKTNNGKVDTTAKVQRNYGSYFNYYEDIVSPNSTTSPAYNRFGTVGDWLGESSPMHTLPVTTNVFTKGKEDQTIKLGYNIGGSLQTVGDYDYSMWIYPQNQLAGDFKTGTIDSPFKLITSDPYSAGNKYQEYYDSNVNNTITGSGILGLDYKPAYEHKFALSLADPRVKLSDWEKKSTTYQKAVQAGNSKKTILGTPSMMILDQSVRTLMGNDVTTGNWGGDHRSGNASNDCPCSYENAQKWNWNYSLPQNTSVWFGKTNNRGIPILETPDKDQYIITSMTFRTKVARTTFPGEGSQWQTSVKSVGIPNNGPYLASAGQSIADWDLTTYTNKGVSKAPDIAAYAKNTPTDEWNPSQGGNISKPAPHIVWWDYSHQATSDKDTIGTH